MSDPRTLRNKRLNNEHKELMRINGDLIEIKPIGNTAPHEKYRITFKFRTIVNTGQKYSDKTVCTLTIPPGYPHAAPVMNASAPHPYHPNWFSGRWCYGSWNMEESLVNYVLRCARTLQHDPVIGGSNRQFWEENKHNYNLVLNDDQVISALDALESIVIHEREKHQIEIKQKAEVPKITVVKVDERSSDAVKDNETKAEEPKITIIKSPSEANSDVPKTEEPEADPPKITILRADESITDELAMDTSEVSEAETETTEAANEPPANELKITIVKRN